MEGNERPAFDGPASEKPSFDKPVYGNDRPGFPPVQRPENGRPGFQPQSSEVNVNTKPSFDRPSFDRPAPDRPNFEKPSFDKPTVNNIEKPVYNNDRPTFPPVQNRPEINNGTNQQNLRPQPQSSEVNINTKPSFDRPSFDRPAPDRPNFEKPSFDKPTVNNNEKSVYDNDRPTFPPVQNRPEINNGTNQQNLRPQQNTNNENTQVVRPDIQKPQINVNVPETIKPPATINQPETVKLPDRPSFDPNGGRPNLPPGMQQRPDGEKPRPPFNNK